MSSFRSFKTTFVDRDQPNWAPLTAVSRLSRLDPDLPAFHPGEFMCMMAVENRRKGVVIWLYKHCDTRCYLNLDEGGHAYEFCFDEEQWERDHAASTDFGGRYRLHRSLHVALRRLQFWEFAGNPPLHRSFPPEQWPDDPDDWATDASTDGERYAWDEVHCVGESPPIAPGGDGDV